MGAKNTDIARQGRRDRLIRERVHDPYRNKNKLPEPTLCPTCDAVFQHGRWQWVPEGMAHPAHQEVCPACRRIQEKVPAGFLTLKGDFFRGHAGEIMKIVRNREAQERAQRPLKRIMDVERQADGAVVISFTDTHLPRDLGEAIQRACDGELVIQYTREAGIVRVTWER